MEFGVVDADTHVIETERTWEYMVGDDAKWRPVAITTAGLTGRAKEYWQIDGRLLPRRQNVGLDTPEETRELLDVAARLSHMDQLGVDVHVLYPTLFLRPVTSKPEVEAALYRGYNRWLADVCGQSQGRMRWAVLAPTLDMAAAMDELRWAKQRGAVSVFLRGNEHNRELSDPYFFPLYEEAARLGLAVCLHAGAGNFAVHDFYESSTFGKFKLPVLCGFHSLMMAEVPKHFPTLRIGVLEVMSQWLPYALIDLANRFRRQGKELPPDVLRTWRVWVACETTDDLPYVLQHAGADNLVIGSDYGHNDSSSELEALRHLRDQGTVAPDVIEKILDANPRALYALA